MKCNVWVAYRPVSGRNPESYFYHECECLFTEASISVTSTVIVGDFNAHADNNVKPEPLRGYF